MDVRTIVCGALAALALVCGTVLAAIQLANNADAESVLAVGGMTFGLVGTLAGYAICLQSDPHTPEDAP